MTINTKLTKIMAVVTVSIFSFTTILSAAPSAYTINVPEENGKVSQRYKGKSERVIIHIQDAHASFEAQKNLAQIIQHITPQLGSDKTPFIGVEGAMGKVNMVPFRQFPLEEARKAVGEDFVRKGIFTGAELAAASSKKDIELWGLEDTELFHKDFKAFYTVALKQDDLEKELEILEGYIALLKGAIYNDELKAFDKDASRYEKDQAFFLEYLGLLYEQIDSFDIDLVNHVQLMQFKEAFLLEQTIDYEELDTEIEQLADLVMTFVDAGVAEYYQNYKAEKITQKEIVSYVCGKAVQAQIALHEYQTILRAQQYWNKFAMVDIAQLLNEVYAINHEIRNHLAVTEDEKLLIDLTQRITRLKSLLALKAVKEDVAAFRNHQDLYTIETMVQEIKRLAHRASLTIDIKQPAVDIDMLLKDVDEFYTLAEARDKAMLDNLLTKMDTKKQDVGVLVAGGYHSSGILKLLKEQDLSFVTVVPNISSLASDGAYMDRMLGKVVPLSSHLTSNLQVSRLNALLPAIADEAELHGVIRNFIDNVRKRTAENIDWAAELQARVDQDEHFRPVADAIWDVSEQIVRDAMTASKDEIPTDTVINDIHTLINNKSYIQDVVGKLSRAVPKVRYSAQEIDEARSSYRHIGISMGGTKLAVAGLDGHNAILFYDEVKWDDVFDDWKTKQKSLDPKDANDVMRIVAQTIERLLEKNKIEKETIAQVSASLAGPVNEEEGIYGEEFPAPNLPFNKYPFRDELRRILDNAGISVAVTIYNDAIGALRGETFSPQGLLKDVDDGAIVIFGTGGNITVKKEGRNYTGLTKDIYEGAHSCIQVCNPTDDTLHYQWVGQKAKGRHPIEQGNTDEEIIRKSGDFGKLYVNDRKKFEEQYPDYPILDWASGLRDMEDRLAGPGLESRLKEAGSLFTLKTLTHEAQRGNQEAVQWLKKIAHEMGQALAAFINEYHDELFVYNIILVSSVSENIGKGFYDNEDDKAHDLDVFMKTLRRSAETELVSYFGLDRAIAKKMAEGIQRSRMTYERELISYQPTDEEVIRDYHTRNAALKKETVRSTLLSDGKRRYSAQDTFDEEEGAEKAKENFLLFAHALCTLRDEQSGRDFRIKQLRRIGEGLHIKNSVVKQVIEKAFSQDLTIEAAKDEITDLVNQSEFLEIKGESFNDLQGQFVSTFKEGRYKESVTILLKMHNIPSKELKSGQNLALSRFVEMLKNVGDIRTIMALTKEINRISWLHPTEREDYIEEMGGIDNVLKDNKEMGDQLLQRIKESVENTLVTLVQLSDTDVQSLKEGDMLLWNIRGAQVPLVVGKIDTDGIMWVSFVLIGDIFKNDKTDARTNHINRLMNIGGSFQKLTFFNEDNLNINKKGAFDVPLQEERRRYSAQDTFDEEEGRELFSKLSDEQTRLISVLAHIAQQADLEQIIQDVQSGTGRPQIFIELVHMLLSEARADLSKQMVREYMSFREKRKEGFRSIRALLLKVANQVQDGLADRYMRAANQLLQHDNALREYAGFADAAVLIAAIPEAEREKPKLDDAALIEAIPEAKIKEPTPVPADDGAEVDLKFLTLVSDNQRRLIKALSLFADLPDIATVQRELKRLGSIYDIFHRAEMILLSSDQFPLSIETMKKYLTFRDKREREDFVALRTMLLKRVDAVREGALDTFMEEARHLTLLNGVFGKLAGQIAEEDFFDIGITDPFVRYAPFDEGKYEPWPPWRVFWGKRENGEARTIADLPEGGWKLHVAAREDNAARIFQVVLPLLQRHNTIHKVAMNMDVLNELNQATGKSITQRGKVIAIYTESEKDATDLGVLIDKALFKNGFGPKDAPVGMVWTENGIGGDKLIKGTKTRLVGYRFGIFKDTGRGEAFEYKGEKYKDNRGQYKPENLQETIGTIHYSDSQSMANGEKLLEEKSVREILMDVRKNGTISKKELASLESAFDFDQSPEKITSDEIAVLLRGLGKAYGLDVCLGFAAVLLKIIAFPSSLITDHNREDILDHFTDFFDSNRQVAAITRNPDYRIYKEMFVVVERVVTKAVTLRDITLLKIIAKKIEGNITRFEKPENEGAAITYPEQQYMSDPGYWTRFAEQFPVEGEAEPTINEDEAVSLITLLRHIAATVKEENNHTVWNLEHAVAMRDHIDRQVRQLKKSLEAAEAEQQARIEDEVDAVPEVSAAEIQMLAEHIADYLEGKTTVLMKETPRFWLNFLNEYKEARIRRDSEVLQETDGLRWLAFNIYNQALEIQRRFGDIHNEDEIAAIMRYLLGQYRKGKLRFSPKDDLEGGVDEVSVPEAAAFVVGEYRLAQDSTLLGVTIEFDVSEGLLTDAVKQQMINLLGTLIEGIKRDSFSLIGDFMEEQGKIHISDKKGDRYFHDGTNDGVIYIPFNLFQKALTSHEYRIEAAIKLFHEFWHESNRVDEREREIIATILNRKGDLLDPKRKDDVEYFEELWLTYRNRLELFKRGIIPVEAQNRITKDQLTDTDTMRRVVRQMALDDVNRSNVAQAVSTLITDDELLITAFMAMDKYAESLSLLGQWQEETTKMFRDGGVNIGNVWEIFDQLLVSGQEGIFRIGITEGVVTNKDLIPAIETILQNEEFTKRNITIRIDRGDAIDNDAVKRGDYALLLQMDNEDLGLEEAKSKAFAFSQKNATTEITFFHSILLVLLAKYIESLQRGGDSIPENVYEHLFDFENGVFTLAKESLERVNKELIKAVRTQLFKIAA
ncbi:MAG: hypothetical protein KKH94_00705 [Candidatus Omnitrophica bacterium]|nr:hypothetical protein [Candidatus Omnitrophota bacterium]